MTKKIYAIALLCIIGMASAAAQSARWVKPWTAKVENAEGKKVYVTPNADNYQRYAITLSYGVMPINSFNSWSNNIFKSRSPNSNAMSMDGDIRGCMGTLNVAFSYEINPWLELNIPFTFSHSTGGFDQVPLSPAGGPSDGTFYENWFSLTPSIRVNWLRSDNFAFYSRVGVGVSLANRYERYQAGMNGKIAFAWQVSPVGIEVGRKICFFAEAGMGQQGMVMAGVKFKIKNSKPLANKADKKQWYDNLIR